MQFKIIDEDKTVEYGGNKIIMARKEFELLNYLHINSGKVVSRDSIMKDVWGYKIVMDTRTVDVHVRKLRKKLPGIQIITRKCFGYMLKVD
jgi:two-component system alkaline phosphatase synthesis response regulator PhoP